jgi:hypothetical protein
MGEANHGGAVNKLAINGLNPGKAKDISWPHASIQFERNTVFLKIFSQTSIEIKTISTLKAQLLPVFLSITVSHQLFFYRKHIVTFYRRDRD